MTAPAGHGSLYDFAGLVSLLDGLYPRALGLVDRDPDSPTFGSCDRHFWMYRLHDFDSGVLQQTVLLFAALAVLAEAGTLEGGQHLRPERAPYWRHLARAIARRTVQRLARRGALDEYYPGEDSYPATVFGAYATLKAASLLGDQDIIDSPGLEAAATRLLTGRHSPASNQDAAAAAFLGLYSRERDWRPADVRQTLDRLLGGARARGVFLEYGGADLGYGTVTLHFLACLRADGVVDTGPSMIALGSLIADFITPAGRLGGEFPSRSTTYCLPYGLLESARLDSALAGRFADLDVSGIYAKLDDRYLAHYCLPSLALACCSLARFGPPPWARRPPAGSWRATWHADAGLVIAECGASAVQIGPLKGGAFQVEHEGRIELDCGYRVECGGKVYATAVVGADEAPQVSITEDAVEVRVRATPLRYGTLTASPMKSVILRLISFLGPYFNRWFKRVLITSPQPLSGVSLERRIRLDRSTGILTVEDEVRSSRDVKIHRAPADSLRLVPSARFHQSGEEDAFLAAVDGNLAFPARRTYRLSPSAHRAGSDS